MSGYADVPNPYRALPSVDRLAQHPLLSASELPAGLLRELLREELDGARKAIAVGAPPPAMEELAGRVLAKVAVAATGIVRVINATGVILHTNLGRAPLSAAARRAMDVASSGYSTVEFDLAEGERGSRHAHVEELLRRLTGAEAAIAVNNNAAALLLALSALCAGREVVISRGELVEIGGGFRIPDVLMQSGARLVEAGTTNRTYVNDYQMATSASTAAYLRVHASNFRISGFTARPALGELVQAAHQRELLVLDDAGSGALFDTTAYGLAPEPMVQESIALGADLVLFSGDKLLGGPQAGIIAGRTELVARLKRHPLARALRMDKGSIAALHATLLHHLRGEAFREVPVLRMLATPLPDLRVRAAAIALALGDEASITDGLSMIGGGSLPGEGLPSALVRLHAGSATQLARALRLGTPAVVARIDRDNLLIDPRTVDPADDSLLIAAVKGALTGA